jgi:tRNA A-37 threonylcarbamoyl transferase component Bud32
MAATPTSRPDKSARNRDEIDDTVPAVEEEAPIRPTIPLDRYRLGKELGRGGMGRVVEAFDVQLGRTVALKEVLTKGTHRRFAREIHITARLEHASIVPLYDSGVNMDGKPYYVMRKVSGKPLDEMVARCRDLDERLTLLPSLLSAIDAVAHAHSRGVIHRDLKPQNILVGELGETVVIDWGLAKVVGEDEEADPVDTLVPSAADSLRTQVGSVFGTPGFMAPEQARGEALDTQGDVYALGATLYQLLSGEPPVRGNSATEVMDKTRTHDIRPLVETAPGAPPDLVAIVAKALAFDANNRYRDASELREDVRRFLDGQLVAAHDYTPWQRIARFGRKHRGVVSVTAIAAVAVAVMAWIGVHRILTERDMATVARQEADNGKREAEDARDRLAERHDALLVMQARGQLDANPTESLAILKQLPASSQRTNDARAISRAAIMRGATWAMQTGSELTIQAELSTDGTRLLQVSTDGTVRVFDLELRRMTLSHSFAPTTRAHWITDGKLLVTHQTAQPQLLEARTGDLEALKIDPIKFAKPTSTGDRLIVETAAKTPAIFDVASRTLTPIPFTDKLDGIEIASDGSWYAVWGAKLVVVFDRDGKELTRREGETSLVSGSRMRTIAVMSTKQVFECVLDPTPVWTEIPVTSKPLWLLYRGRELATFLVDGTIQAWAGKKPYRRGEFDRMTPFMREVDDDVLVWLRDDGDLQWIGELGRGTLKIPSVVSRARLAGRPGVARVAVVADGVIVVYDLTATMPRRIPGSPFARAVFIDDETLLVMKSMETPWEWFDLKTGKSVSSGYREIHLPRVEGVDPADGRVLIREMGPHGPRFVMLRKNASTFEIFGEGERGRN